MGINLFDEEDNTEDISTIETNPEFARRFEHNKKREELQRLQELKKKGVVSLSDSDEDLSESEEEDSLDLEDFTKDKQLCEALVKIRNKDPSIIANKDVHLFESSDEESGKKKKKKGEKPLFLKNVSGKMLIEDGPEGPEEDENDWEWKEEKEMPLTYNEEQEKTVRELLRAAGAAVDGEEGEFLKEKRNEGEDGNGGGQEEERVWDEYFGGGENLDENEKYLRDFFSKKLWKEDEERSKGFDERLVSEEEEELERQEEYEARFNFRHEENAGDRVLGHARFMEGTVRKTSNARKLQRQNREERKAMQKKEMEENVKHMKNLFKKEIQEKHEKIRAIGGISEDGASGLKDYLNEEEFDLEKHNRMMNETYDNEYYGAEDADPGFASDGDEDIEKPDFAKEDELLKELGVWDDENGSGEGFEAIREKILKRKAEEGQEVEVSGEEEEKEGKRKRKRKSSLREKAGIDKELLDEYYKMDFEGTIGDVKTRFKYAKVQPKRFHLSTADILMKDDKELNQYVPVKALAAPYREKEWKPSRHKYNEIVKNKVGSEGKLKDHKSGKKNDLMDKDQSSSAITGAAEQGKPQVEEANGEVPLSRKARRRQRQAELKLSESRRRAFGEIPDKPKKKKKH